MALFGTNDTTEKKVVASKKQKKTASKEGSALAYRILVKPRITEKAHSILDLNKYVFQVAADATKVLVKKSVEETYGVSVAAVNIVSIPSKKRNFGRFVGRKSGVKKAIVTLKKGDSIDLFQAE